MTKQIGRAGMLAVGILASAAMGVSVIPSQPEYVKDLAGNWRFKLEQTPASFPEHGRVSGGPEKFTPPEKLEPFEQLKYAEGPEWKDLAVPGNWEMAGFAPATFNQPYNEIGLYRLEFDVPKEWEGRIVKIDFDGIQNGAEIYCNGQPVKVDEPTLGKENYHQGGNDAFQADLTPVVKFGEKNLLAVRVYKNPEGVDLDTGDFFFLGGIHRKVTLFSTPKTHLEDIKIETKVMGEKAELRVKLAVAGGEASADVQLEGFEKLSQPVRDGKIEFVQTLDHPKLWSAEKPNLYTLSVDVKDASGKTVEHIAKRVGVREVSIEGGVLMVNHVPVKFTGMCRHENYAPLGTAMNEEIWRKDITMMKAANVNAIRTSHYPYGSGFYDLCDELGMYVMDEMSAGWVATDTQRLTPFFQQHAREMVRRDKNHPSIVIWAIGNENKKGFNNKAAADEIRKLDDTRPRLVSWRDKEEADVELDDRHYTDPADIQKANNDTARRKTTPMAYLENPNDWEVRNGADWGCDDLWVHILDRTWKVVWDAKHVPGSFLWEWADRAVTDKASIKLYDYDPETGVNYVKAKGVCDGFRNPRPMLYHVKMVYAPIKVDLKPAVDGDTITVHAQNYYSFTDLSELKTTWHLLNSDKEILTKTASASLPPLSKGDLKFQAPSDQLSKAEALRLDFDAPDGRNVATYLLRLKPEPDTAPQLAETSDLHFPRFNLVAATWGNNAIGWRTVFRHPAKLTHIHVGSKEVASETALYALPLSSVPEMDADVVMADGTDEVVGKIHAGCSDGHFTYRLQWLEAPKDDNAGAKGKPRSSFARDVQELGWIFGVPASQDHFSWHRKAFWSWYPETHVGRAAGTATPDSADQRVSKITRPDAFDFNSTKYDCDWATLADTSGTGIGVKFSSSQRHHVKAGTDTDGKRELIVNRYSSPPRDLSSSVVPDLYFTLTRGTVVEGGFDVGSVAGRPAIR